MKHLILYAHPNPASLSHAMKDLLVETYEAQGAEVVVRDLYAMGFDPVLKGSDFVAMKEGKLPEDITMEQSHITWADALTVVAPVWWTGLPAILKGYVDRVFLYGFAYQYGAEGVEGLLKGKKVLLVSNHGTPIEVYQGNGMLSAMSQTQDDGMFRFCGMDVVDHLYFGAVPSVDEATRKTYLDQVRESALKYFGRVTA
ncbi:MAG: NAD(P)H-dependent oxidoreductase [Candidatus Sericytochromatia bacterium]|nr:NAD(P)H-dependent oxidoreductase [Candidatus Sericytochromatia bacterium]